MIDRELSKRFDSSGCQPLIAPVGSLWGGPGPSQAIGGLPYAADHRNIRVDELASGKSRLSYGTRRGQSMADQRNGVQPAGEPSQGAQPGRAAVLDPIDRVSEVIFGVLMAVSFTGSISVATAGSAEVRTMIVAAFGCNLAWGLTDAVMYLVGVTTEGHRKAALLRRLQSMGDTPGARQLIADALPERLAAGATTEVLEGLRLRLIVLPPRRAVLGLREAGAALAIFALVVLATVPVALPFLLFHEVPTALRVSNLLALATLFVGGYALGKYAGGRPWSYGLVLTALGGGLMAAIIALGG